MIKRGHMTAELITQITTMLDYWNAQVQDAANRITVTELPAIGGFWTGVILSMESARDELAAALAGALADKVL